MNILILRGDQPMVNVKIEFNDGIKTWVYTESKNAFLGNKLYFMGEWVKVVELDHE